MNKCIFLLLVGVALMSCRENPEREACIRKYYEYKIEHDSVFQEFRLISDRMIFVQDSLEAIGEIAFENDLYNDIYFDWTLTSSSMKSLWDSQQTYYNLQKIQRRFGDRNYFRIYKKELIKQGRIKE